MKNIKSALALLVTLCMMICLAVPAFATEATETTGATVAATTEATEEATATTEATEDATASTEDTTAATEEATEETTKATEAADEHDHDHDHEDTTTTGTAKEESGFKKAIRVVLIVLEVIVSIVLILVVLFQSGKEAGLSALTGNSDSYLSKNGGSLDKALATATKWVALAWIVVTLLLCLV